MSLPAELIILDRLELAARNLAAELSLAEPMAEARFPPLRPVLIERSPEAVLEALAAIRRAVNWQLRGSSSHGWAPPSAASAGAQRD